MNQLLSLAGRQFLVTGASSGIGRATAILISTLGGNVICCGRDLQRLDGVRAQLLPGNHHIEAFDLNEIDSISERIKIVAERVGPLHGIVHAAGLQSPMPVFRIKANQWEQMRNANLDSFVELVRAFQNPKVYSGSQGRIVVMSSVLATHGSPGRSAYAATKGAIEGMIPSLALELAPRNICVNAVAPAFVKTQMYDDMARFWSEEQTREIERRHPLGFGLPEDVAGAIAFLLADTGRWITGTVLRIDGGYSAG